MVACLKIGFSPCKAKEKSEIALMKTKGFPTGEPSETKGGGGVRIISLEGFCIKRSSPLFPFKGQMNRLPIKRLTADVSSLKADVSL